MPRKKKGVLGDLLSPAEIVAETIVEQTETPTAKAARKSRKKIEPIVSIQSIMGGEITIDEIKSRVEIASKNRNVTNIYIKAESNKAYYVLEDGETGSITLWD